MDSASDDFSPLDSWQLLVETIGEDGAAALVNAHGGTVLYLSDKSFSVLTRTIGIEKSRALVGVLGPHKWMVPMGPSLGPVGRRRLISKLLKEGKSHREAARTVGVHVRTVERVSSEMRKHERQRRRIAQIASGHGRPDR